MSNITIDGLKDVNAAMEKIHEIRENALIAAYNQLMADNAKPLYIYLIFRVDPEVCSEKCGKSICDHNKVLGVHAHTTPYMVQIDKFESFSCEQYSVDREMNVRRLTVILDRKYAMQLIDNEFYKQELAKYTRAKEEHKHGTLEYNGALYFLDGVKHTREYAIALQKRNG